MGTLVLDTVVSKASFAVLVLPNAYNVPVASMFQFFSAENNMNWGDIISVTGWLTLQKGLITGKRNPLLDSHTLRFDLLPSLWTVRLIIRHHCIC